LSQINARRASAINKGTRCLELTSKVLRQLPGFEARSGRQMKAHDVMTTPVVTVKSTASVKDVARLFLERKVSAVPVVDNQGKLVGIISEGDLLHRSEIGTSRHRPWWLVLMAGDQVPAADYIKANAKRVADVMTRDVTTAAPDTPLDEIAVTLEQHGIKRLPIMRNGELVGIVSRANLVQAIASSGSKLDIPLSDTTIREKFFGRLTKQGWAPKVLINATVNDGVVDLWGFVDSDTERKAIQVAAEATPGVKAVNDHMFARPFTR
jgi:CBS domain-containing protein